MGGHKKHKKKHKKEKKKSKKRSSSSSESSGEELWVEKKEDTKPPESHQNKEVDNDDWLSNADQLFKTVTREKPKAKEKNNPERISIDEMGKSSRELNPYWKDGGTGLPEADSRAKSTGTVGDLGLGWLRKALDRAKQTASDENRPLEEVVAPVWGSLDKLLNLIKEAERKVNEKSDMRRYGYPSTSRNPRDRGLRRPDSDESRQMNPSSREEVRSRFRKPSDSGSGDQDDSRSYKGRPGFRKPESGNERLDRLRHTYRDEKRKSWKKPSADRSPTPPRLRVESKRERTPSPQREEPPPQPSEEKDVEEQPEIISQDEMNQIAAEILRAEMFGNEEEVKELKDKLKKAQGWLAGRGKCKDEQREVILTRTDRRGFTHPVQSSSSNQPSSKRKSKVQTHQDGKRVRYFGDDDKHSLQDLVHHEKFVSVADQNEMYAKLAKGVGQKSDDDDFEEGGGREKSEEWAEFNRRQRAAVESSKREKALDLCNYCLDSTTVNRRLIISLMEKAYLSVPPYQSLTDGHCLIMPIQHVSCSTLLDEDVWEEIMDLRKLIVKMFLEEDKDVIFYESAKNLSKFPHMVLNCIPVSREVGDEAPIYFKKALLECETEWSNNKKVVDLKGRDVRKAVPKGLPYFAVDFGHESGFAHVIEDEQLFPRNFAEEIIGGMMDLHHSIWRKRKKEDQQVQIAKTQEFIKKFKAFMSKKTT